MKLWRAGVFGALAAMLSLTTGAAFANGSVNIRDDASVLSASDRQQIQQAAQAAPFGVTVWTTSDGYRGNRQGFYNAVNQLASRGTAVIAVDTGDRLSHFAALGTGLPETAGSEAKQAMNSRFASGDWAGGITAALNTLAQTAPAGGARGPVSAPVPLTSPRGYSSVPANVPSGGGFGFGSLLVIALVVGALVLLARRVLRGNRGYGPNYGPGFPGGNPGANAGFGPGYGSNYNPGGGVSPLVSGGLGALGGGLLGYEMGKAAGEREDQQGQFNQVPAGQDLGQQSGNDFMQTDAGGSGATDFGGSDPGGGADFGGGGADFGGGGADFGGGGGGGTDF